MSPLRSSTKRRAHTKGSHAKRGRAGYTLIEIMTALAILMIGATGIFAIQTGATVANMESRRMGTANQVAQTVVERMRRDALSWRSGGPTMDMTALATTTYLVSAPASGAGATLWMNVPANAFDYYGRDTTVVDDMAYCAQMRMDWVSYGQSLRADVRVYYPRRGNGSSDSPSDARTALGCPDLPLDSATYLSDLHFVHTSTIIRWTPSL